jgi:NDP-hexose 4,6-dehydratase
MTVAFVQDQHSPPAPAVADADTQSCALLVLGGKPRAGGMTVAFVQDRQSPPAPAVADADRVQPTELVLGRVSRPRLAGLAPPSRPARARWSAPAEEDTLQFAAVLRLPTIDELCATHVSVCESAVDPLEIASALEFDGIGDNIAAIRYGCADVFALAEEMYRRVPRNPVEPEPPPDPWRDVSKFRPALHGLLYGLPGVCFPAAAALLVGPRAVSALVVSLLVSWATSQALAYLGYVRLGQAGAGQAQQVLRAGLAAGLTVLLLVMACTAAAWHVHIAVIIFCMGQGAYMLGAGVLLVLGAERLVFAALAPGVLGSAVFVLLGRPSQLEHAAWAALAATPLLALILAVVRTSRPRPPACQVLAPAELARAAPTAGFGLVAAGLLTFPVVAVPGSDGQVNTGALLAALPLSLSMGAAEWSLLWYRRRMQQQVRTSRNVAEFGSRSRLVLVAALLQYLGGAVALTGTAVLVATRTGLVHSNQAILPELAVYLALGGAMFIALLLQAFGDRGFPLAACAVALVIVLACRSFGVTSQLAAYCGLLVLLSGYAAVVLGRAVRHVLCRVEMTRRIFARVQKRKGPTMTTVAVTGAEGFIGSHLVELLVQRGHRVRAMVLYNMFSSCGWLDTLEPGVMDQVEVVFGDVRDPASARELVEGAETVYHLAALGSVPYSYSAPRSFVDTNTIGTLHVLEAVRAGGAGRLVHTSTSETYGTARTVPISESHPLQAQSPYAATKVAADKLVESYCLSFGLPAVTLRPFNTFGPRQSTRAVIPQIITQLAAGARQIKLGALNPTRDFCYVTDTASAFVELGAAPASAVVGELFNCGPGDDISIGQLAEDIAALMGIEADIVEDAQRLRPKDSEVMRLVCDASKLRERTGWQPLYTRNDGLRETITWFCAPANLARYKTNEYHQ